MADLSKVKVSGVDYNLKDAAARDAIGDSTKGLIKDLNDEISRATTAESGLSDAIAAEETRATGAESGLDNRIKALESKGRYLSTWDATSGKPDTYPEISQLVEGKYNYRAGDYYIVNKVAAENNLMPDGAYISYDSTTTTWTVPTKAFTGTSLNLGDQFQYDGTKWTYIASATTVAFANIQGDAEDNTNLKGKLDAKLAATATVAGVAFTGDTPNVATADLQAALGLDELAYAATASGSYTPAGSVTVSGNAISDGSVTVALEDDTAVAAEITAKAAYTPAGTITGSAISGGSITVTVKDATSATAVTDLTYENYTPAGTIAAKATGGTSSVLASASLEADASGVAVTGTVSKPNVTITAGTEKTFATGLTGGKVASFTEGAFTAAAIQDGFYTAGSDASLSAGAQASLTDQAKAKFVKKAHSFTVGSGADAETLIIGDVETSDTTYYTDAVTDRGTFTANTLQTLTGGKATVIDTSKFSGGSKAADTFVANELQDVSTDKVHDTPTAALAEAPTFTGDKFRVATTTDTVLKDVEFTGTAAAVKLTGAKYLKQEIDTASFAGTTATLGFSGTERTELIPSEITYKPKKVKSATFTGTAATLTASFAGTAATITVQPD